MTQPPTVLACGLATLDVTQVVDRVPGPNEKVTARSLAVAAGGPALNAAITAARLGCRATLLTRVGAGGPAAAVRAELGAEGVALLDAADDVWTLPVSTVLVTRATGERAVVSTNDTGRAAVAPTPMDVTLPDGTAAVLVDGHHVDLALGAAAAARAAGVPVLLDGGSWKPGLGDLLALVDVAVLSADLRLPDGPQGDLDDDEVDALLAGVADLGPAVVARSSGPGPVDVLVRACGRSKRGRVEVQQVDDDTVVDTLGAGDVLHGAALAGLARLPRTSLALPGGGHGGEPADAGLVLVGALSVLTVATRVATASVQHPGARGWTDDLELVATLRAALDG
ncbi:PfkB family carbohydrate kinase [Sanguibacter sp. HDW7]|uniref:PfkB family carbohydrate kinase n=1 Tax=Sanguibacter sp. HDW7 TaxID=2714931 RepID=UPI001409846E|nr:PfkB family carbohydrate kinase [Sanguibacter sp. HDW7]QIK82665.1 carbohydrate kinase [Sanguibacter sp. HDW7]